MQRVGIVQQRLFHADAERREQEAALEPLRVHQLDARLGLAVRGADRLELAERVADVVAGGLAAEVLVERSRAGRPDRTCGFGMKRKTLLSTIMRCLPSISAHCTSCDAVRGRGAG